MVLPRSLRERTDTFFIVSTFILQHCAAEVGDVHKLSPIFSYDERDVIVSTKFQYFPRLRLSHVHKITHAILLLRKVVQPTALFAHFWKLSVYFSSHFLLLGGGAELRDTGESV